MLDLEKFPKLKKELFKEHCYLSKVTFYFVECDFNKNTFSVALSSRIPPFQEAVRKSHTLTKNELSSIFFYIMRRNIVLITWWSQFTLFIGCKNNEWEKDPFKFQKKIFGVCGIDIYDKMIETWEWDSA